MRDFKVAAAQEAAHQAIEDTQMIRLSGEDEKAFAEAIINPLAPNVALIRAAEAYRSIIKATQCRDFRLRF